MQPPTFIVQTRRRWNESAAAIVITLIFLALISVMIIAMSDMVRVDRGSSVSYVNQLTAEQMAQRGINHVVATLNKETGDISRNWITQPGQLVIGAEQDNPATEVDERKVLTNPVMGEAGPHDSRIVPLHSGTAPAVTPSRPLFAPPNLNLQLWGSNGDYLIDNSGTPMNVKWIYVRENGDLDPSDEPVLTNTNNPIIGRYAFWTDDESTKINLNLAWSRSNPANTLPPSSPTHISLTALPGFTEADATTLHQYVTLDNFQTVRSFFNSPTDAFKITSLKDKLRSNKFNITHYSHDPQTTFFNEKRIVLTTQKKYAGNNDFLDILVEDNTDPGWVYIVEDAKTNKITHRIDEQKLSNTIKKLITYLRRKDWPMVPETATKRSFQAKYFQDNPDRLAQLALGIIEYVRAAESEKVLVEPIRVRYNAGSDLYERVTGYSGAGGKETFIGSPRRLYITEVGIWAAKDLVKEDDSPVKGKLKIRLYVEVHLAENGGIDEVDLLEPEPGKKLFLYINLADQPGYCFDAEGKDVFDNNRGEANIPRNSYAIEAKNIVGGEANRIIRAGEYRTIVYEFYYFDQDIATSGTFPPPNFDNKHFNLRYALTIARDVDEAALASRIEVVPLANVPPKPGMVDEGLGTPFRIEYTAASLPDETASPTEIPSNLFTMHTDDPRVNATAGDWRMGRQSFGQPPPSGVSSLGKAATGNPPPDADSSNRITNVSFRVPYPKGHPKNPYGFVTSSAELCFVHTGLEGHANRKGVPWRTLRLQPTKDTSMVPDWALIDLFTVPSQVSPEAAALLSPYGVGAGRININTFVEPFNTDRTAPLKAILLNARTSTSNTNARLTEAQVNTIVENIRTFNVAGSKFGNPDAYDSPGEIVEIAGIADKGEDSEELLRSIINQITTRSNVFGIYTVGQALQQTRSGDLKVLGEHRQHAIVERYQDKDGSVRFRTVFYRNLNP